MLYSYLSYLFHLHWILVVCSFGETTPFLLSCHMYESKLFIIISFLSLMATGSVVIFVVLYLILAICVFFSVFLEVCQFLKILLKNCLIFPGFPLLFLFSIVLISALVIISFIFLALGLFWPYFLVSWAGNLLIRNSFSDAGALSCEFPSQHCFSCMPQILIRCVFISILSLCIFNISKTSSLAHGLFRTVLFGFHMLAIFLLSFCYWFLVWFYYSQRRYSDCNSIKSVT